MNALGLEQVWNKCINGALPAPATLCLVLFIVVGCVPSMKTVEHTADQTKLARIATGDNSERVRLAAVEKLTDQAVLARLAIEDKNVHVRSRAMGKLTDQAMLVRVAVEARTKYNRLEAVRKLTDQAVLAKIAVEDRHEDIRHAAVQNLANQAVLARIAMEDKSEWVRLAAVQKQAVLAVEKLTDQAILAKIAVEDKGHKTFSIRLAAVKKINDQALLAKIAVEDWYEDIRHAAVQNLANQAVLARIAMEDKAEDVRRAAVEKLTDQAILAKVAVKGKWLDVRLTAVEKLTDQPTLARVAVEGIWLKVRLAAIGKLTDQVLLRKWAEKEPQAAIRQAVVMRIDDDRFLVQRLPMEPSAAVRTTIIKLLRKEHSLRGVALTSYHEDDRKQAFQRLKKKWPDSASEVFTAHIELERKVEALANELDNNRLLTVALDGEFDVLRGSAARWLNDSAALEQAALRSIDREVLKILMAKLEDKDMLDRIAKEAEDRAMRLAAAYRVDAKSWKEIFSTATAKGATIEMLGDAISAVSLFQNKQQDAVKGVQHACLNLIRRGNESRIPEMVGLIEGYGNKTLAEDYLNCGQPDLGNAGRSWARTRGYNIDTGSGSHRATWGSGR